MNDELTARQRAIRVWRPETLDEDFHLRGHADEIRALAPSPDGRTLASCDSRQRLLWDLAGDRRQPRTRLDRAAAALAFHPDGQTLACACGRIVELWDERAPGTQPRLILDGPT